MSVLWHIDSAKEYFGIQGKSWMNTIPIRLFRTFAFGTLGVLIPVVVEERAENMYVY